MSHHIPAVRHISEHALSRPGFSVTSEAAVGTNDFADPAADLGTMLVPYLQQHRRSYFVQAEATASAPVHSPRRS